MAKTTLANKTKNATSPEKKRERLEKRYTEWVGNEITLDHARSMFMTEQAARGNSEKTLEFYLRFFKKLYSGGMKDIVEDGKIPVNCLVDMHPVFQVTFVQSLGDVNIQTVNAYLRAYRAFGNYCEEQGYIEGFKCPIKEVEPDVKQVYTVEELKRLTKRPDIEDFVEFRNYCIVNLLLACGARERTIINIQMRDLDFEEGYITFNTTKTNKKARIGMDKKLKNELMAYISRWRYDTEETDYVFCNQYGEQMKTSALQKTIAAYNNKRGVTKTSIHLFRHTFAKMWLTSGGDIMSLQKVLLHSELEMVKRYANLYCSDVKKQIQTHSALSALTVTSGPTLRTRGRPPKLK